MAVTSLSDISRFIVAGVDDIFTANYEAYPTQYPQYTVARKATKETMIHDGIGNLAPAVEMQESEDFSYNKLTQTWQTTIKMKQIGNGFSVSLKARKFNLYDALDEGKIKELAHTIRDKEEEEAIEPWDDAFTVNQADGYPICSDTKPLYNTTATNDTLATGSCTGASGYDNIKAAVKLFSSMKNHQGKPKATYPNKIFTKDINMMDLEEVLDAKMKPFEQSNTPQRLPKLTPIYTRWLTSDTAWFLLDDKYNPVIRYTHTGITQDTEEDFDNKDLKMTIYELLATGAIVATFGTVGSLGT